MPSKNHTGLKKDTKVKYKMRRIRRRRKEGGRVEGNGREGGEGRKGGEGGREGREGKREEEEEVGRDVGRKGRGGREGGEGREGRWEGGREGGREKEEEEENKLTLVLHTSDVSLSSPVNSIRQSYSAGGKEGRPLLFCFIGEVRTKSKEKEAVFIDCQITELVHGQRVRVSFGVVLLDFL